MKIICCSSQVRGALGLARAGVVLAVVSLFAAAASATTITMRWSGTVTSSNISALTAGENLGGVFSVDDAIVGTANNINPAGTDYDGLVGFATSGGGSTWLGGTYAGGMGGMQVFDNSQNFPNETPRDALVVHSSSVSGPQIGGLEVTWMRVYWETWGASLNDPPTVLTSRDIPTASMTFGYGVLSFYDSNQAYYYAEFTPGPIVPVADPGSTAALLACAITALAAAGRRRVAN